jgi:hypothetical protein
LDKYPSRNELNKYPKIGELVGFVEKDLLLKEKAYAIGTSFCGGNYYAMGGIQAWIRGDNLIQGKKE